MKRRGFLTTAGAGVVAITARSADRVHAASSRVSVALVGCGERGSLVAGEMKGVDGAEIDVVCDVQTSKAERARQRLGGTARVMGDFRRVLEMKEVDAVLVATPDHWHPLIAIAALEAGKHVYCEKPIEHTIQEGLAIVEASRIRPDLVFLTGTQHRSAPHIQQAAEMVQGGEIGEVRFVSVWNYSNSLPGIPLAPDQEPPPDMDWDFYLGPAPRVPYNPNRHGPTYRAFSDYSSGRVSDYGVHRFDSVHQIMGADTPTSCISTAHRYQLGGAGDHPDVLLSTWEYPGWMMTYEALELNGFGSMGRTTPGLPHHGSQAGGKNRPNGMMFAGTRATLLVDRRALELVPEPGEEGRIEPIAEAYEDSTGLHAQHFIRCIRDGETPRCGALVGHRGGVVCHLANISWKVGRKLRWDPEHEVIVGDPEASALLGKKARRPWDRISL